jgi:hypothetical protein
VHADANAGKVRLISMHVLKPQREQDSRTGRFTSQEAAIARPVDNATAGFRRQPLHLCPMPGNEFADGLVTSSRLQRRRIRQISEDQRENPRRTVAVSPGWHLTDLLHLSQFLVSLWNAALRSFSFLQRFQKNTDANDLDSLVFFRWEMANVFRDQVICLASNRTLKKTVIGGV